MRLTIIVPDESVGIDGLFWHIPGLADMVPEGLHALQWYGDKGEEEYLDRNKDIFSLDPYQAVIAAWHEANTPIPLTLEQRQDIAWREIQLERDRRQQEGGFQVGGYWFHSDNSSRIQHLQLKDKSRDMRAAGAVDGDQIVIAGQPVHWKTMTGEFVPMVVGLPEQVAEAAEVADAQIFAMAEQHRQLMLAAEDPESYDFSGGWPTAFWERDL